MAMYCRECSIVASKSQEAYCVDLEMRANTFHTSNTWTRTQKEEHLWNVEADPEALLAVPDFILADGY